MNKYKLKQEQNNRLKVMESIITNKKVLQQHLVLIELLKLKSESEYGFLYLDEALKKEIADRVGTGIGMVVRVARSYDRGYYDAVVAKMQERQETLKPKLEEASICC